MDFRRPSPRFLAVSTLDVHGSAAKHDVAHFEATVEHHKISRHAGGEPAKLVLVPQHSGLVL